MSIKKRNALQMNAFRALFLVLSSVFAILCSATIAEGFTGVSREFAVAKTVTAKGFESAKTLIADNSVLAEATESRCDRLPQVPSQFGASFETSQAGFDEILGISAFVPLAQNNCGNLTFLTGDAQLNDGNLGLGLNLGYRNYDADDDLINGGYLGVDSRATDDNTFYQLAAGYEHIRQNWELRLNGYLPLGDLTQSLRTIENNTVQTSSTFSQNQLAISAVGEQQQIFQEENALGGMDLEVGRQLSEWDDGELMGYVGAYWLAGEDSSLGAQARLLANIASDVNAGLSYQYDDLFGSSLGVSVSAVIPGSRSRKQADDTDSAAVEQEEVASAAVSEEGVDEVASVSSEDLEVLELEILRRLGSPIVRRPSVAINVVEEIESTFVTEADVLFNPQEGSAYRFLHVDLADPSTAGEGTYESPFGSVEEAIALIESDFDTYSDGNTIVYVNAEGASNTTIPGFSIPDSVRVLSQGPVQTIAGMDFPGFPNIATRVPFSPGLSEEDLVDVDTVAVTLPDSNDGVFPTITGGNSADLVTLSNNTVLAGFEINNAGNHGVAGSDIENVELRNNLIQGSGGSGIALNNVGGNVVLLDNAINDSTDRGILIENNSAERGVDIAIAGFELNNNRVGMEFRSQASGFSGSNQSVTVGPSLDSNTSVGHPSVSSFSNTVSNSLGAGIILEVVGDSLFSSATQEVLLSEVTVDGGNTSANGSAGIRISSTVGSHAQEVSIADSLVTRSSGNGIEIIDGTATANTTETAASQEVVIRDSSISNNGGNGIDIFVADVATQELVVRNNRISDNGGDGIRSLSQGMATQEWRTDAENGDSGISENTISGNGGQAIVVDLEEDSMIPILSIVDNDLSGNDTSPDIEITSSSTPDSGAAACLVLDENVAPTGIRLAGVDPSLNGNARNVRVENLAALLSDSNVSFFAVIRRVKMLPLVTRHLLKKPMDA